MDIKKKVFVVEDDRLMSALLCRSLTKHDNYQVSPFFSGEEALEAIRKEFPDILIIDFQLPGMNGIELFETIKPDIPTSAKVIMASAVEDGNMVLKFIQKGVRNFLIKDSQVLESLDEILSEDETHDW